jgi:hypothetical protein
MKVHIVGYGLIGRLLKHRLTLFGIASVTYDAGYAKSGFEAAGRLLHSKWWTFNKDAVDLAKEYYSAQDLGDGFYKLPNEVFGEHRADVAMNVTHLSEGYVGKKLVRYLISNTGAKIAISAEDEIVFCVGSWTGTVPLLKSFYTDMKIKAGIAFSWLTTEKEPPLFFKWWAPFKSITRLMIKKGQMWASDGCAMKEEMITEKRRKEARERTESPTTAFEIIGRRPYTAKVGLYMLQPNVWTINGAGKKGCMVAIEAIERFLYTSSVK